MRLGVVVLLGSLAPFVPAEAREYTCTNKQLEITCANGACEKSESFTAASVSADTRTKRMSICLYSTCHEGKADRIETRGPYLVAIGTGLKSNAPNGGRGRGVIVIDTAEKSGSLVALNFRSPLTCETR